MNTKRKKKRKKKNIEWRVVCIRNGVRGSNIWVTGVQKETIEGIMQKQYLKIWCLRVL